ncbi:hypothetical protein U1Q18_039608, partial [Sarracenia purpurea var. burkii]
MSLAKSPRSPSLRLRQERTYDLAYGEEFQNILASKNIKTNPITKESERKVGEGDQSGKGVTSSALPLEASAPKVIVDPPVKEVMTSISVNLKKEEVVEEGKEGSDSDPFEGGEDTDASSDGYEETDKEAKKEDDLDPSAKVSSGLFPDVDGDGSVVLKEKAFSVGEEIQAGAIKESECQAHQVFVNMPSPKSAGHGARVDAEVAGFLLHSDGEMTSLLEGSGSVQTTHAQQRGVVSEVANASPVEDVPAFPSLDKARLASSASTLFRPSGIAAILGEEDGNMPLGSAEVFPGVAKVDGKGYERQ